MLTEYLLNHTTKRDQAPRQHCKYERTIVSPIVDHVVMVMLVTTCSNSYFHVYLLPLGCISQTGAGQVQTFQV